jgi:DNA-binding transcriptional LysR family regulator
MSGVNLRDLDLKLLVVFEAIYSAGNISRAADKLAMSQPAVSNQLARLRDLIGDPLFARGRRGVEPTVKAQTMIGPVREALGLIGRQFGDADEIDLATYRRTFRISLFEMLETILMPPIVSVISERAPGISIEGSSPHAQFAQDILSGTLDLACYSYPITSPDISVVPLAPVEPVVIARRNHPRIGTTLDAEALGTLGFIGLAADLRQTTMIDRDLLLHGIKRRLVYGVPRMWSIPGLVASTDLIAILPRQCATYAAPKFDLDIYEIPVKVPEQHMHMAWHTKMDSDPGHKWFRETMLATARDRLGAPASDAPPNVTPFVRPARAGLKRTPPRST